MRANLAWFQFGVPEDDDNRVHLGLCLGQWHLQIHEWIKGDGHLPSAANMHTRKKKREGR